MEKRLLTVRQSMEILERNGVTWTEVWLRTKIAGGTVRSVKKGSRRLIPSAEIERVIADKKQYETTGA